MTVVESHAAAMAHLQAGRLTEAERTYREILRQDTQNVEALLHLGIIAGMRGQYRTAVELTGRASALRPDTPAILMNLGRVCRPASRSTGGLSAHHRNPA